MSLKLSAFPKVVRIVQSTFSSQMLQQLEREESNPYKFHSVALNLIFILNVSFLVYKINSLNNFVLTNSGDLTQFCFFFAIVAIGYFLKSFFNATLAFFTEQRKVISEYVVSATLINQSFGLFLFPLIVFIEFSPFNPGIFVVGAIMVLVTAILLRWYRGIILGLVEERIGLLQIFSYFCSLEILPVIVLVKYIIETF